MKRTTYKPEDFSWTKWTPQDIENILPKFISYKKERLEAVKNIKAEDRNFENTVYALANSDGEMLDEARKAQLLLNVSPDKEVREKAKEVFEGMILASIDLEHDEELYRALKEYASKNEVLEGADQKLFEDMFREYKRLGFDLDKETQFKVKKNIQEIASLSETFEKNINDYSDFITVTKEELAGLPESFIEGLEKTAEGNYKVSLDYPEYVPFVENAHNAEKRRELVEKRYQRGGSENINILKKIFALRHKNAGLLGYKNYVDYVTETRMAKNSQNVSDFLNDLITKLEPLAKELLQKLAQYKKEKTGDKEAKIEFYDLSYYLNQYKKENFSVDQQKIQEYFPFEKVKTGMFKVYSELLGITFEKIESYPLWHSDVELWSILDDGKEIIGYFSLDLFPRPNKFSHACISPVILGRQKSFSDDSVYITPFCPLISNFTKPTKSQPSLLTYEEVKTLFHEFGHVMHSTLTKAKYVSQSGCSVSVDFVEAPSQMLENWMRNKEIIKLLSSHYKNSEERLPDELIDGLLEARKFSLPIDQMVQVIYSLYDFRLHLDLSLDINNFYSEIFRKYTGIEMPRNHSWAASFGHLAGYDAGYYGYLWSKVYAADMFTRFESEGLLNKKTGQEYRKWILEKGSSVEEIDLVRGFLEREPNNQAFLKQIGL